MTEKKNSRTITRNSLRQTAISLAKLLEEKKGEDLIVLNLTGYSIIADYFVIVTGRSRTHTEALAFSIMDEMGNREMPLKGKEGFQEKSWILLDYGDIVVHIFLPEERQYYNLEKLWSHTKFIYPPDL